MVITVPRRASRVFTVTTATAVLAAITFFGVPHMHAIFTGSSADALMFYCERTIKPGLMEKYKTDFAALSHAKFDNFAGAKAMFSVVKKDATDKVLQVYYFDSMESFFAQPKFPELETALLSDYGGTSETDVCTVFGDAIVYPELQAAIAKMPPNVRYAMKPRVTGFMKPRSDIHGPPIFIFSERPIQPDLLAAYGAGFTKAMNYWVANTPGIIASYGVDDAKDPSLVWDMRVFANFEDGWAVHVTPTIMHLIPTFRVGGVPGPWSNAAGFGPPGIYEKVYADSPGNARYKWYDYNEIIGPAPDFGK